MRDIVPAVKQFGYRNKLEYTWTRTPDGPAPGFHEAGRWDALLPLETCLLAGPNGGAVREAFRDWARGQGLDAYEQQDGAGYLRHLVVREGIRTGEVLCILVTSPGEYPDLDALEHLLAERCPSVVGVLHAINEGTADSTQGLEARIAFGRGWFEEELLGLRLRVSAGSFMQTNTEMTDLLYAEAVRRAALTGGEVVWDLYSGIGSIALALAGGARRVIGVEIVEEAVERARENALLNGVANAEFVVGDAAKAIRPLLEDGLPRPDVVVVDPPRAGLTPRAVRRVVELYPKRLVYVSCNPTTLAGNGKLLAEAGYALSSVTPFDLFPHTPHVECAATFERVEPASVGRKRLVPLAERPERVPEGALRGLVVERVLDGGHDEHVDRRRQVLHAEALLERACERELERVQERHGLAAHRDDDLGLHDRDLSLEPARRELGIGRVARLQAVRAVEDARVDAEALHGLEHRLACAPEERDALGQLGRSGCVLEQEDVRERVPRAEDAAGQLMAELVGLADRARQVLLVDLILRQGSLIFARTRRTPTRPRDPSARAGAPI